MIISYQEIFYITSLANFGVKTGTNAAVKGKL
jgi:hypothetical protein